MLCVARTILSFPETGLEVVERQVADLILQAVEIHGCGLWAWSRSRRVRW